MYELTRIVAAGHQLRARAFHRDLRSSNVMMDGYYSNPAGYRVVVLDFDLAWHVDASERSVVLSAEYGYIAPEQLARIPGISTRSGAVDSFGSDSPPSSIGGPVATGTR